MFHVDVERNATDDLQHRGGQEHLQYDHRPTTLQLELDLGAEEIIVLEWYTIMHYVLIFTLSLLVFTCFNSTVCFLCHLGRYT